MKAVRRRGWQSFKGKSGIGFMAIAMGLAAWVLFLTQLLSGQNGGYVQDPKWQAPATASAKTNPLAGRAELVAGGRKIFLRDCAQCHRADGSGLPPAANLQLPQVQQQSDGALFW